jgi:diacylglycerol kinase (ATP)
MKLAKLLHNPTAGDEEHDRKELVALIEAAGFRCRYSSTKNDDWKDFDADADLLVVAGGDGTVRKITKELLSRKVLDRSWPIALLPLGTANNIAKTLQVAGETEYLIQCWHQWKLKKYDVGILTHIDEADFFLESFGYGIFPYLMKELRKRAKKEEERSSEESKQEALRLLLEIIESYEPRQCQLELDGEDYSGRYLLVEIMNIRSIGPNLFLAPDAQPDDGKLDVVLVPEEDKDKLADYVANKRKGIEQPADFRVAQAQKIKVSWDGTHVHVDDEVLKIKKETEIGISIREGLLEFLVP